MTQKRAEELWPIIKAFAEGKTIQRGNSRIEKDGWRDIKEPYLHHFNINDGDPYRIKPTPTLRPWKPEEVPLNALFKFKANAFPIVKCIRLDANKIWFIYNDGGVTYNELENGVFARMEHSTDNGKTWKPCGVEE